MLVALAGESSCSFGAVFALPALPEPTKSEREVERDYTGARYGLYE